MAELTVFAPHDGSPLATLEQDDPKTVDAKVRSADAAMAGWAERGSMERAEALLAIAHDTQEHLGDLAHSLSLEQGKTLKEARLELERYVGPFIQYAGMATIPRGSTVRLSANARGLVERGPVGVVGAIVPWNFPASLFGTKLAPALAAGCGFVIKPAPTTPLTTLRLAEIAGAHLPAGLLQVVVGGAEVGRALVGHDLVRRVAFTGSSAVGREVARQAGAELKRVSIEAGGCDPFVLCGDADLRGAARALMGTRFYNAGQVCVAPKRLIVHEQVVDDIVVLLEERMARVELGPGTDPASTMGPLHMSAGRDQLEEQIEDATAHGAELVGGGRPDDAELRDGPFLAPALLIAPGPHARVRVEETFGPVLTVLPVASDEEAVRIANETPYGLGASVWSGDQERAFRIARQVDAGYTWINTLGRVYDELPFGGVKASGFGREHGEEALESYLEPRAFVHPT